MDAGLCFGGMESGVAVGSGFGEFVLVCGVARGVWAELCCGAVCCGIAVSVFEFGFNGAVGARERLTVGVRRA